jgi:hypothetical protein
MNYLNYKKIEKDIFIIIFYVRIVCKQILENHGYLIDNGV